MLELRKKNGLVIQSRPGTGSENSHGEELGKCQAWQERALRSAQQLLGGPWGRTQSWQRRQLTRRPSCTWQGKLPTAFRKR